MYIKSNSVTEPGVSQINYIDKDLNDTLDEMVAKFNAEQIVDKKVSSSRQLVKTQEEVDEDIAMVDIPVPKPKISAPTNLFAQQRETEEAQTFESAIPDPKIEPMTEEIELDIDEM